MVKVSPHRTGGPRPVRVVFAGTPDVAVPALDASRRAPPTSWSAWSPARMLRPAAAASWWPARSPCGRRSSAYPCSNPDHPRDPEFQQQLRDLAPDCCPVVAYGALLPQSALDIPPHGWVNLHFSCLPAWRGAAPVQHAIWAGDEVTGATTFRIVKELDAGPTFGVMTERIRPDRHRRRPARATGRGRRRAAGGHARRHRRRIPRGPRAAGGRRQLRSQDRASPTPRSTGARRPWRSTAGSAPAPRRPAPGPPTTASGSSSAPVEIVDAELEPGTRPVTSRSASRQVLVGTGTTPVRLGEVQAVGKRLMAAADWARGLRATAETIFGAS